MIDGFIIKIDNSGPSTSSFSSTQIINGKSSSTITTSYNYTVSAPNPGEYTIDEAEVTINGITYKSNILNIKILKTKTFNIWEI